MIKYFSLTILAMWLLSSFVLSPKVQDAETFSKEQMEEIEKIMDGISEEDWKSLNAATLYKQNCSTCHGRKGDLGMANASDLTTSELDLSHKYAMIHFGKGTMFSYESRLSPAEILSIAHYLDTLKK